MKKSSRSLSILLLEGNKAFQSYLDPSKAVSQYLLRPDRNIDGVIFMGEDANKPPSWLDFLQDGALDPIPNHYNASTRGVLLVRLDDRVLALTFGYGRFLIKEELIVRNFGLKTALNGVDPEKLQSVDLTSVLNLGLQTKMQSSKRATKSVFGHEMVNDLLRVVVGTPLQRVLGNIITGQDSLSIRPKLNFSDLKAVLELVVQTYENENYKSEFGWIDDIKLVKGGALIEQLNNDLLAALNSVDRQSEVALAPPEPIDWSIFDCASFGKRGEDIQELEIAPFLSSCDKLGAITIDVLKRRKVFLKNSESEELEKQWKVYDCLVFETSLNDTKYVLTSGVWYEVSFNLAESAKNFVDSLQESELQTLPAGIKEIEGTYNKRLSDLSIDHYCMDKQNVKCEFAKSLIEPCDIITADRKLVHVKPGRKSSTLSHLFAQGRVAAEAFKRDREFRKGVRRKLKSGGKIPIDTVPIDAYKAEDFEIVFLFIDDRPGALSSTLPFFSQVNMMHTVTKIRMMGYQVSYKKVLRQDTNSIDKVG